nr:MAG TPA: portal protein [Caudoviricetes sp.]
MKFLGYNITKQLPEKRELDTFNPNLSNSLQYGLNSSKNTALSLSTVYSAVNLISDAIACLPITIKAHNKEGITELDQHPLKDIFSNNLTTKYTLFKTILQSVLLKGNAYCYIERKGGKITGLRYLQSEDVQTYYRKETKELYYTCGYLGGTKRIMPSDMLHFLKYTVDGVQGISVLSHARRSLNIANQTENTAETFFSSGCNLNGVIKVHSNLSNEQKQDIATSWRTTFGQGNTSGGVVVVPANMDYQPISVSGEDAQMLESRQFNVADIARFFNISPVLLGDLSNAGYSTIEATNLQFLSYTLNPYIVMIEEELNRKLVSGENLEINLDETAILRTDKAQQASYYSTLLSMGVLSINEVRKELGLNAVEGGDNHNLAYNDVSKSNIAGNEDNQ